MKNLFLASDYRTLVQEQADILKNSNVSMTYAHFAKAMNIQPTYLSRVFQKIAHLNGDQLHLACSVLGLSETETDFAFLLMEFNRAGLESRRKILQKKINAIRDSMNEAKAHLEVEFTKAESSAAQDYYLDPMVPVVHAFLTVPRYRREPLLVARALGIPQTKFRSILERLEKFGIIRWKKQNIEILKEHLHLDRHSILHEAYQQLFRHASIERLRQLGTDEKLEFSVTLTADDETRIRIRNEFNIFIKKIESLVRKAPSEKVFQMNFDFFPWDRDDG